MKTKLMVSMIALAATMVSLSGCKDDDDDKKPSNSFSIDGSKKAIKTAFLLSDPEPSNYGETYYSHQLNLLSDGFTINGQTIEGKGNAIRLWTDTPTTGLDEGTYSYVGFEAEGKPFQIRLAAVFLDFTIEEPDGEQLQITSGEMTVSKSDDIYTIKFEGVAGGKTVTCSYTGPLLIKVDD